LRLDVFVFPEDFERFLYTRMMTDRDVKPEHFNVEPTHKSGVTVTTLCGVRCIFTTHLPHGTNLLVYDTGYQKPAPLPPQDDKQDREQERLTA
jgi:hypothetical protein